MDLQSNLAVVSSEERMEIAIDDLLIRASEERESIELSVSCDTFLSPNDRLHLIDEAQKIRKYRIREITTGAAHKLHAVSIREKHAPARVMRKRYRPEVALTSRMIQPVFLDIPLLQEIDAPQIAGYLALHAANWPGGVDVYRSDAPENGYKFSRRVLKRASVGELSGSLPRGTPYHWNGHSVEVTLLSGAVITKTEPDVLRGENALALLHPDGNWEIAQFQNAELIGERHYRLSRFLRGQLGTEALAAQTSLPAGTRAVALDQSIIPVELETHELDAPLWWKFVPMGEDPGDPIFTAYQHSYKGIPQQPYAPVSLKTKRSGDVLEASWIRSTRIKGDSWPAAGSVPLGETTERYHIELSQNSNILASLETDKTTTQIPTSPHTGLATLRVAQISETYGPGTYRETQITL